MDNNKGKNGNSSNASGTYFDIDSYSTVIEANNMQKAAKGSATRGVIMAIVVALIVVVLFAVLSLNGSKKNKGTTRDESEQLYAQENVSSTANEQKMEKKPFLSDLNIFSRGTVHVDSTLGISEDVYGTVHEKNIIPYYFANWGEDKYVEYCLNGDYSELEFVFFIPKPYAEENNEIGSAVVNIYLDDKLVSSHSGFDNRYKSKKIQIDVRNVDFIKIQFEDTCLFSAIGDIWPAVGMGDMVLR